MHNERRALLPGCGVISSINLITMMQVISGIETL